MAKLKVFISSTCYDLAIFRSELKDFVESLGYETVLSEYSDVLFDPRIHTHTSCINEVENCDMLVFLIGSRHGGKATVEALEKIDLNTELEKQNLENASITQLEVLKAYEIGIPVYTFIDKKVYYNHEVYEKNKENNCDINYPGIEKQDTAKYIFEFINFIRKKAIGNSIYTYERIQDVQNTLKKQWSGYFQKLLSEQRYHNAEEKKLDSLNERFEDLKTAILTSMSNENNQRDIANGIVRYKRLVEFLLGLNMEDSTICESQKAFRELLMELSIVQFVDGKDLFSEGRYAYHRTYLIKEDDSYYEFRYSFDMFMSIEKMWDDFINLDRETKYIICETIRKISNGAILVRPGRGLFSKLIPNPNISVDE